MAKQPVSPPVPPVTPSAMARFFPVADKVIGAIVAFLRERTHLTGWDLCRVRMNDTRRVTGPTTKDPATGALTVPTAPLEAPLASLAAHLVDWGFAASAGEAQDIVRLAAQTRPDLLRARVDADTWPDSGRVRLNVAVSLVTRESRNPTLPTGAVLLPKPDAA